MQVASEYLLWENQKNAVLQCVDHGTLAESAAALTMYPTPTKFQAAEEGKTQSGFAEQALYILVYLLILS
jgi:hypothetical protein